MSIEAQCPKGHGVKVPNKFGGQTIRCPTCQESFTVPGAPAAVATMTPVNSSGASGFQLTPITLALAGAAWIGSLLLAMLLGAFVSRSMGPSIVVESQTPAPVVVTTPAPVNSEPGNSMGSEPTGEPTVGLSAEPVVSTAPQVPVPNFRPSTTLPSNDQQSTIIGAMPEAGSGIATSRGGNPRYGSDGRGATVYGVPEGGSGVAARFGANSRTNRSNRSNSMPSHRSFQPRPQPVVEQLPAPASATMSAAQAVAALKADLSEAVSMLDKRQYQLLAHDFLPMQVQMQMRNSSRARASKPMLSDRDAADLKAHLQAAMTGEMGFNRNHTLVEIQYVRQPVVVVPPGPPQYIPSKDEKPTGRVPGLGSDLPKMLQSAAALMEADKPEDFIRNVYPYAEIARLSEADFMERMIVRINSNPAMKKAMLRDLAAAAKETPVITNNEAQIKLPPLVSGDEDRVLKFQLVDGNWRFYDGLKETRAEYQRLVAADVPPVTIPGSRGTLLLSRVGENWRLNDEPVIEPLTE